MTDRELMQQALEALEWNLPVIEDYGDHEQLNRQHRAITALREKLAQPEPPVLTGIDCSCGKKWRILNNTLTASEPETVMAAYKHQTYAAYKTGGEMKIGVVPEQEPVCAHDIPKTKCSFCRVEYKQPDHDWEAEYTKQVELHNQTLDELRDALEQPEQKPVAHSIVAGALFDFMGWLTSRDDRLVLSSTDDAGPAADAIKDFAQMRSLSIKDAQVQEWQEHLATPPRQWVGLTDEELAEFSETKLGAYDLCLEVEAKLKEKNT